MGYGKCPNCGETDHPRTSRERRMDGNTKCGACGMTTKSSRWATRKADTAPFAISVDDEDEDDFFYLNVNKPFHQDDVLVQASALEEVDKLTAAYIPVDSIKFTPEEIQALKGDTVKGQPGTNTHQVAPTQIHNQSHPNPNDVFWRGQKYDMNNVLDSDALTHAGFVDPNMPTRVLSRKMKLARKIMAATIAVDLDGTIAHYDGWKGEDHFGHPRDGVRQILQDMKDEGHTVIINTIRGDKEKIRSWLEENKIPFDHINENPDQPEGTSNKIMADVYWDDRAVNAQGNLFKSYRNVKKLLSRLPEGETRR